MKAAAFGCFANMGQICMSTERLIVDEKIADAFVEKFAAKAESLPHGDPRGHVVLGSLVTKEAAVRNKELLDDAVAKGAKLAAGGEFNGTVVSATVLDHVTPAMRIYARGIVRPGETGHPREGRRGSDPRRQRHRVRALGGRVRQGHARAPSASPSGSSPASATSTRRPCTTKAQMPFGGTKASGYGRFGGKAAIDEFTELRWITIQTGPHPYPF